MNTEDIKSYIDDYAVNNLNICRCKLCPYMSLSLENSILHVELLHLENTVNDNDGVLHKSIQCPGCEKYFESTFSIKRHLYIYHQMLLREINEIVSCLIISNHKNDDNSMIKVRPEYDLIDINHLVAENILENFNTEDDLIILDSDSLLSNSKLDFLQTDCSKTMNNFDVLSNRIVNETEIRCDIKDCGIQFSTLENLKYHRLCHMNDGKELQCPECALKFTNVAPLHTHLWNKHKIDIDLYECDKCTYKAYSLYRLNNIHRKIHSDERNYACEICDKRFKNSKQLTKHRTIHKVEKANYKKFVCNLCQRVLKNQRLLTTHMRSVHEKLKQFSCDHCKYSASVKSSLIIHMKLHTGEKPYSCKECDFKTSVNSSLKRHMKRHSSDKKYKCDQCSYSCIQAQSIKNHVRSKHPGVATDLLNSCPHCSYTTVNKFNYTTHLYTHSEVSTETLKKSKDANNIESDSIERNRNDANVSIELSDSDDVFEKSKTTSSNPNIFVKNMAQLTNSQPLISFSDGYYSRKLDDNAKAQNAPILMDLTRNDSDSTKNRRIPKISVKSNLVLKGPDKAGLPMNQISQNVLNYKIVNGNSNVSSSDFNFGTMNKVHIVEDYTIPMKLDFVNFLQNTKSENSNK